MTTPGKTTPLPWELIKERSKDNFACSIYGPAGAHDALLIARVDQNFIRPDSALIVTAVNTLHAIAPGREIELVEALPEIIEALQYLAAQACFYKPEIPHFETVPVHLQYLRIALGALEKVGIEPKLPLEVDPEGEFTKLGLNDGGSDGAA